MKNKKKRKAKAEVLPPKLLRRPMTVACIAVTVDIIMLAAAVVMNILRDKASATYYCTAENTIAISHPYELFGIPVAVALVINAAVCGIVLASAFVRTGGKVYTSRIVGSAVLLAVSVGVIFFSYSFVLGEKPLETKYFPYTDETTRIIIAEEHYSGYGRMKVYKTGGPDSVAELKASTELMEYADNDRRYKLSWITEDMLLIGFTDGVNGRTLQIDMKY